MRSLLISIAGALVTCLTPAVAFAQAGVYVRPSLAIAEVYDSNILSAGSDTGNVEGDFITRVTPGGRLGYESEPFTISAGYHLDGELYADHSDLNQMPVRQVATVSLQQRPTLLLTTSLDGGWAETQIPSELNSSVTSPFAPGQPSPPPSAQPIPPTNIQVQRSRADLAYARPALSYRIDPLTDAGVNYGFSRTEETNAFTNVTHEGNVTLDRRLSPLDAIPFGFNVRSISSTSTSEEPAGMEPSGNGPSNNSQISYAPTIGWERRVTSALSFDVRAGPRFTGGGNVDPEISANVSYALQRGLAYVSYSRTTTTAVGVSGPLDVQTVSANLSYELTRFLVLNVGGAYSHDQQQSLETTDIYRAIFSASYLLTEYVSLILSYNFAFQQGSPLGSTSVGGTAANQNIYRSVLLLGMTATYPYRLY
jgi:Putative beta-barrel porin 2